jgi:hypothetical protein
MSFLLRIAFVASLVPLAACNGASSSPWSTDAQSAADTAAPDPAAVQKFVLESVYPAFGVATVRPEALAALLTDDARLRWPNQVGDGKDAFVRILADAFKADQRRFVVAATNYKFLVTQCHAAGGADDGLRPAGLPASVDLATFDPANITPDVLAKNPGLLAPSVDIQKLIQGQALAAGRFLVVAKFKHAWMRGVDAPYWYVDRFVVRTEGGALRVEEYEFTANLEEIPAPPALLTACP